MNAIGNMTPEKLTGNVVHEHIHVGVPCFFRGLCLYILSKIFDQTSKLGRPLF